MYRLKVTLRDSKPAIWRRLLVPGRVTLAQLHQILQVAFAWEDRHLHDFEIDGVRYGVPCDDGFDAPSRRVVPEDRVRLEEVAREGSKLLYLYDFGDDWYHVIHVEAVEPAGAAVGVSCLGGKRAAPPEDSGGIWGYEDKLAVLADPKDPDHEELSDWMPANFDPAKLDLAAIHTGLAKLSVALRLGAKAEGARSGVAAKKKRARP